MPTTNENKTKVQTASDVQLMRNSSANIALMGSQLEGQSLTFSDDIMNAVRADRQSRGVSKIATDVGNTMGQLVSDPEAIRARTSGMVAPTQVNALTAGARATNLGTLATQATQQELNQGSLDKIIQAGANQLKARAAQMTAQAVQESAKADALMETLKFKASEASTAFDQWLAKEKLKQTGTDNSWVANLLAGLNNKNAPTDDGFIPEESVGPGHSPASGEGSVSSDKKWIFKNGQWVENSPTNQGNTAGFFSSALGEIFTPLIEKLKGTKPGGGW